MKRSSGFRAIINLSENKQMTRSSFESSRSLDLEIYSTPDMSDDMHEILSPSFDSFNEGVASPSISLATSRGGERSTVTGSYSVDSIIRRVEEEIATARKAASNVGTFSTDVANALSPDIQSASSVQDYLNCRSGADLGSSEGSRMNLRRDILSENILRAAPSPSDQSSETKTDSTSSMMKKHLSGQNPNFVQHTSENKNRQRTSQNSATNVSLDSLSDDDLQAILGIDDIEEKKTAQEPFSRKTTVTTQSGNLNAVNPTHLTITPFYAFGRFEAYDRYGNTPIQAIRSTSKGFPTEIDSIYVDPTNRKQFGLSSASPGSLKQSQGNVLDVSGGSEAYFHSLEIRRDGSSEKVDKYKDPKTWNPSIEYQPDMDALNVLQHQKFPLDNVSRSNTPSVSGTGADSIYFTDEEWQVENDIPDSTTESRSRSTSPSLHSYPPKNKASSTEHNVTLVQSKEDDLQTGQNDHGGGKEHLSSRVPENARNLASFQSKGSGLQHSPALTDADCLHPKGSEPYACRHSIDAPITKDAIFSSSDNFTISQPENFFPRIHSRSSNNENENLVTKESFVVRDDSNATETVLKPASVERVDYEYPIVQKSSTEDAIVSVQHHPVFQKRITAVDSIGCEVYRSVGSTTKRFSNTDDSFHTESHQVARGNNEHPPDFELEASPIVQIRDTGDAMKSACLVSSTIATSRGSDETTMARQTNKAFECNQKVGSAMHEKIGRKRTDSMIHLKVDVSSYTNDDFSASQKKGQSPSLPSSNTHNLLRAPKPLVNVDLCDAQLSSAKSIQSNLIGIHDESCNAYTRSCPSAETESDPASVSRHEVPSFSARKVGSKSNEPQAISEMRWVDARTQHLESRILDREMLVSHFSEEAAALDFALVASVDSALDNESNQHFLSKGSVMQSSGATIFAETPSGCNENNNVDMLSHFYHKMNSNEVVDSVLEDGCVPAIQSSSAEWRATSSEWDKASELLYRLKEQRVSFSASFSPSQNRQNTGSLMQDAEPTNSSPDMHLVNVENEEHDALLEEVDSSKLSGDNGDGDVSSSSNSANVRSPRYFNFMRVKRAKLRAKKLTTSLSSTNMAVSMGLEGDEDASPVDVCPPSQISSKDYEILTFEKPLVRNHGILSTENKTSECQQINIDSPNKPSKMQEHTDQVSWLVVNDESQERIPPPKQVDPPMGESVPRRCSSPDENTFATQIESFRIENQSPKRTSVDQGSSEKAQSLRTQNVLETCHDDTKLLDIDKDDQKSPRRIYFRNPFPIVKPSSTRRDIESILNDHRDILPDIPTRWVKPKKELKQLIVAAMGTSLARRSNACGALKILSRHKKNQLTLARTDGFLTAVTFAATQAIPSSDRALALDSRTRAVAVLRNVCLSKDNRVLILKHPGAVESFLFVIQMDKCEGRALATSSLALLAKTPICREGLSQVEGLVDVLSGVMRGCLVPLSSTSINEGAVLFGGLKLDEFKSSHSIAEEGSSSSNSTSTIDSNDAKARKKQLDDEVEPVGSIRHQTEEKNAEFVAEARSNACATLLHLSKQCIIAVSVITYTSVINIYLTPLVLYYWRKRQLCCNKYLLESLVDVSNDTTSPLHSKCLEIICNLTRFHGNNAILSRYSGIIDTLVTATSSNLQENRLSALRSLQNMSADVVCKSILATSHVLTKMISCAMRRDLAEKEVAVAAIYNISTEPSAVAAITNTKNVVATLVHLAHSPDSSACVRLLACEALSTISLWLQTLAGTGKVPIGVANVPLPSQKTSGWQRWD